MKVAVIKTGGKQYKVQEGDLIKVEKLDLEENATVNFEEVLLAGEEGEDPKVGAPLVAGAKVTGKVVTQARYPKITIIKHKAKKRQLKKQGHRQPFTQVKIEKINF